MTRRNRTNLFEIKNGAKSNDEIIEYILDNKDCEIGSKEEQLIKCILE